MRWRKIPVNIYGSLVFRLIVSCMLWVCSILMSVNVVVMFWFQWFLFSSFALLGCTCGSVCFGLSFKDFDCEHEYKWIWVGYYIFLWESKFSAFVVYRSPHRDFVIFSPLLRLYRGCCMV